MIILKEIPLIEAPATADTVYRLYHFVDRFEGILGDKHDEDWIGIDLVAGNDDIDSDTDKLSGSDDADELNGADGDTLLDIEGLIGSDHDDVLVGNQVGNELSGGAGNDLLAPTNKSNFVVGV